MKTTQRIVGRIEQLWVKAYNTPLKDLSFQEMEATLKLRRVTEEAVTDIHAFCEKMESKQLA